MNETRTRVASSASEGMFADQRSIDAAVHRLEEVLGLQAIGDPVDLVVGVHQPAKQRGLCLDVGRRFGRGDGGHGGQAASC